MDCKEIIIAKLKELGADGLCCEDCGCSIDDLCPCGEDCLDCVPAKKEIIGEIIFDTKTKRSHCDVKETRFVPIKPDEFIKIFVPESPSCETHEPFLLNILGTITIMLLIFTGFVLCHHLYLLISR